jgi:hypothetical protein
MLDRCFREVDRMNKSLDEDARDPGPGDSAEANGQVADGQPQQRGWVRADFVAPRDAIVARRKLISRGISKADIRVQPATRHEEMGWKGATVEAGGAVRHPVEPQDTQQFWTDLKTGVIVGATSGFLVGLGVGLVAWMLDRLYDLPGRLVLLLENPISILFGGLFLGVIVGGLIPWIVRWWHAWLKARLPLPAEETILIVHCDDEDLSWVSEELVGAHPSQLHVSASSSVSA